MKRILAMLLALVMCMALLPVTVSAAGDTLKDVPIPKPAAPDYFMTDVAYDGWDGYIRIVTVFDNSMLELGRENDIDPEGFYAKYGITNDNYNNLYIKMQYDVNVDGRGWQYTSAWDEEWGYTGSYSAGYDQNYLHDDLISEFTLADAYHEETRALYGDMIYLSHQDEYGDDVWRFDLTNHSVQVRCRYYMEYYCDDVQMIRTGDWSDIAVVGRGSTQRVPTEPKSYAAPIISEMKVVPPEKAEQEAYVYFELDTPDTVWDAQVYYEMHDELGIDELDAQISVNGGAWQDVYVGNSHWPLYEGDRVTSTTAALTANSHVKLRVRYGGPLGYSDWSNVLEVNSPKWSAASSWATGELYKAQVNGLIPDCLIGTDLTQPITRAEFAAVSVKVYEALTGETAIAASENPFTDTTDAEVLKAYNTGITAGTGDGTTFSPDAILNREQAATMLTRVYKKTAFDGWSLSTDGSFALTYEKPAAFADDANISDWAKDSVYFMAANGIIKGVGDGTKFAPKNTTTAEESIGYANATREQALLIAVRMVENLSE